MDLFEEFEKKTLDACINNLHVHLHDSKRNYMILHFHLHVQN
jgi:hypothetical protein